MFYQVNLDHRKNIYPNIDYITSDNNNFENVYLNSRSEICTVMMSEINLNSNNNNSNKR